MLLVVVLDCLCVICLMSACMYTIYIYTTLSMCCLVGGLGVGLCVCVPLFSLVCVFGCV